MFKTPDEDPAFTKKGHGNNKQPRQDHLHVKGDDSTSVGKASSPTFNVLKKAEANRSSAHSQGNYKNELSKVSKAKMGMKGVRQQTRSKVPAGMPLIQLSDAEQRTNLAETQDEFQRILNEIKANMEVKEEQRDTDTEFQELLAQLKVDVKLKEAELEAKRQAQPMQAETQRKKEVEERKAAIEEERRVHKAKQEAEKRVRIAEELRAQKARQDAERRAEKARQEAEKKGRIAEELRAQKAQQDAECRAEKARQEAEKKARIAEELRAQKARQGAERRAEKARQEVEKKARIAEELRAQKAQQDAEPRAEKARQEVEKKARIAEELRAQKAQQDAERRAEKARQEAEKKARIAEELRAQKARQGAERRAKKARQEVEKKARIAEELQAQKAQQDAERRAEKARQEAEKKARIAEELRAQKAQQDAERRAEKARQEAEKKARIAEELRAQKARQDAERRAEKARQEAEKKARIAEELRAQKAQQDAERRAEKARQEAERRARLEAEREAKLAERRAKEARLEAEQREKQAEVVALEASATIQKIALGGSAMVTCSAGIDVRRFQCSSDCCFVSVKNLPKDVKASSVEELLVQQGIDRSMFCLLQLRRVPATEARIMVDAEVGRVVATGLDGSQFGESNILLFTIDEVPRQNTMGSSSTKNANILTVSWNLPSRIMIASYLSHMDAQNTVATLKDTMYNGRKIRLEIDQGRNKTISIESSSSVKIYGLSPDADPAQVQVHVKATGIRAVKSPIYDLSQLHQTLKEQIHGMESYDIAQTNYEKRGNIEEIHVRFTTWEQAKKVYDSLDGKRIRSDLPVLRARLAKPYQFLIHIPLRQYRAQKARWDSIAEREDSNAVFVQIVPSNNSSDRIMIRVQGEDRKAVGALKVRVENLVAGQKLNESLWHRSFTTAAGHQFLDSIYLQTNAVVRSDWKSQSLILYADNAAYDTIELIRTEVQRLEALEFSVTINQRAIGFFMRKGLQALKEELGEDAAMLDINATVCKLVVRTGGEVAWRIVNRLLEESRNNFHHISKDGDGVMCPVCFDTPSAPVLLGCGHLYCSACIRHCLTSAVERKGFPLLCVGDEDRCKVPIAIPIIQRLLSVQQFDRLVEVAATTYIEKQPDKFKYCATPDCSQIYRCDGDKKSFDCPSCLASVCIACKNVSHEGMSCEDWNLLNDVAEQERRNEEWASTAGAKKCSRCQVFIQKIEGCNRIQCLCGAHICWICLAAFNDSNTAYGHLSDVHGGVFDYQME